MEGKEWTTSLAVCTDVIYQVRTMFRDATETCGDFSKEQGTRGYCQQHTAHGTRHTARSTVPPSRNTKDKDSINTEGHREKT